VEGHLVRTLLLETRDEDLEPVNVGAPIGAARGWLAWVVATVSLVACTGGGSSPGTSATPPPGDVYSIAIVASMVSALPKCM
jgi:hypothetical protein